MPYVNIKYQLTLDATVQLDTDHFYLQGQHFKPTDLKGGDNLPDDVLYAADSVTIDMIMTGAAGQWKIAVWVIKLDPTDKTTQIGVWKPLKYNGTNKFANDIVNVNSLLGDFKINWA